MSAFQNALVVREIGKPVVSVSDRPIPEPQANQVQVKVSVAGLNPHDQKARDWGLFIKDILPAVLTNDVVGTVTKLGENVKKYAVGDRIVLQPGFTPGSLQNGLQQYALADISASAKIPDSISDDEAATLPTNIIAPLVALFDALQIPAPWTSEAKDFDYAGMTLLIIGGGSNCGKFGAQLAKLAGIGKIVVVGGREDELTSYGATSVLNRHGGDEAVLERIKSVVGDDLVYAYDAVNPPSQQTLALRALSSHKRGALARLLSSGGSIDESKVVGKEAGYDVHNVFGSSQVKPHLSEPFWERLPGYLQDGRITPLDFVVKKGLEAVHVNEVLDAYRDGKPITKTHIHVL